MKLAQLIWIMLICASPAFAREQRVFHDEANKRVTMADAQSNLVLRLSYDGRCVLDIKKRACNF